MSTDGTQHTNVTFPDPKDEWDRIGGGTFNIAYISGCGKWIFKKRKVDYYYDAPLDEPDRAVRLWNEFNSNLGLPNAKLYTSYSLGFEGWICPYIEGSTPSDKQIREKVYEIYINSGRIILDGFNDTNFILTESGEVVCIDFGLALKLNLSLEEQFKCHPIGRPLSPVNSSVWDYQERLGRSSIIFLDSQCKKTKDLCPLTHKLVKALFFINIFVDSKKLLMADLENEEVSRAIENMSIIAECLYAHQFDQIGYRTYQAQPLSEVNKRTCEKLAKEFIKLCRPIPKDLIDSYSSMLLAIQDGYKGKSKNRTAAIADIDQKIEEYTMEYREGNILSVDEFNAQLYGAIGEIRQKVLKDHEQYGALRRFGFHTKSRLASVIEDNMKDLPSNQTPSGKQDARL